MLDQVGFTGLHRLGRHLRRQPFDRSPDHHRLLGRHVSGCPRVAGQVGPLRHTPGLRQQRGCGTGRHPIVRHQMRPRRRRTTLLAKITVIDLPHQPRNQLVSTRPDRERLTQSRPEPAVVQRPHGRIRQVVETVIEPTQQPPHLVRRQRPTRTGRGRSSTDRHTPRIEAGDENSSMCSTPVDGPCGHPNLWMQPEPFTRMGTPESPAARVQRRCAGRRCARRCRRPSGSASRGLAGMPACRSPTS